MSFVIHRNQMLFHASISSNFRYVENLNSLFQIELKFCCLIKGFCSFPKQSYSLTWDPMALKLCYGLSIVHSILSTYMSVSLSGLEVP